MDDLLYDPTDDFLDDTARLLGELESEIEGYLQPGPDIQPDFEFVNPYAAPGLRSHLPTSPYDYLMDDIGLKLDAVEAEQQAGGGSADPQPRGVGDVEFHEPETRIYWSFESHRPLLPETDLQEHRELPSVPWYRPRRLGRSTGVRASPTAGASKGRSEGKSSSKSKGEGEGEIYYWCVKRGDLVSRLTEECEDCQEECDYAGGGFEGGDGAEY